MIYYHYWTAAEAPSAERHQADRLRLLLLFEQEDLLVHPEQVLCSEVQCIACPLAHSPYPTPFDLLQVLSLSGGAPRPAIQPEDRHVVAGLCGGGDAHRGAPVCGSQPERPALQNRGRIGDAAHRNDKSQSGEDSVLGECVLACGHHVSCHVMSEE